MNLTVRMTDGWRTCAQRIQIIIRLKDQTNALKDQTNPLKDQTHEIMNLQNRHAFGAETTKSSIIKDEPSVLTFLLFNQI